MPGIFFTQVWMLAGLAALAVPVVIHLLLKRKTKRLRFSTVQFFLKQDEQSSQRRKLRNWLLLALRLLICALLVLAFARPFLKNGAFGAAIPRQRQVVVILDRSLSMQAQANPAESTRWTQAKEAARRIFSELRPDDRAALVGCGGRAEALAGWGPPGRANQVLAELAPTLSAGNFVEALQQSRRLLAEAEPGGAKTLYIISDLQRSACHDLASCPLPQDPAIKIVKIGDLMTPNLAVSDLKVLPQPGTKPYAIITSFSDEDVPELKMELAIDSQPTLTQVIALPAGSSTNLELRVPALKPGWHEARLQIRNRDALTQDNSRFQTFYLPEPIRVLIAETRSEARSFEQETFFLRAALEAGNGSTNDLPAGFSCETLKPDELTSRLAGNNGHPLCDVIVLPALRQVPSALSHALLSYVQGGGGLLLFAGEGLSGNRYDAEFKELLPGQIGSVEQCADWESAWRIGAYSTNRAPFAAFQTPGSGNLSLPRFTQRFAVKTDNIEAVEAQFEDGTPLVVSRAVGKGRVVLVNTSADTSWNDWPKHKTYVPWLHTTLLYLANSAQREPARAPESLASGTDNELELGARLAGAILKVRTPSGKELNWTADNRGVVRDVTFSDPGVYSLREVNGTERERVAVNVPVPESDLGCIGPADFSQQLVRLPDAPQTTLAAGLFGAGRNQRELWRVLLLGVLVLLLAEVLIANRSIA